MTLADKLSSTQLIKSLAQGHITTAGTWPRLQNLVTPRRLVLRGLTEIVRWYHTMAEKEAGAQPPWLIRQLTMTVGHDGSLHFSRPVSSGKCGVSESSLKRWEVSASTILSQQPAQGSTSVRGSPCVLSSPCYFCTACQEPGCPLTTWGKKINTTGHYTT